MAVVLNDLLGISNERRTRRNEERMEQFPSYEEFWAQRNEMGVPKSQDYASEYGYNDENDYQSENYRENTRADYRAINDSDYRPVDSRNEFVRDYRAIDREDYRARNDYRYGENQYSSQSREIEQDINYGGKSVSSPTQLDFRDAQARNTRGEFNSCLYAVRDELSSVSDSQFEDSLYDKLAYTSPLASAQQMRMSTRKVATESTARTTRTSRLTFKGKVILAFYIALAVLITTLIAVNASGFNGTERGVSAGNNVSYAETATEVEAQATSTPAEVAVTNSEISYAKSDYDYATNTNWFDRFCDKLDSFFS